MAETMRSPLRSRPSKAVARAIALFEGVGGQVRRRREALGLTVEEAAKRANFEPHRFREIEQGLNWSLTTKGLEEIATALDCTIRIRIEPNAPGDRT